MKKTALFLFMLFAFVMKAQEIPETVLLGEATDKNMKYYIYPKTVRESERSGYIMAWFLFDYRSFNYSHALSEVVGSVHKAYLKESRLTLTYHVDVSGFVYKA